MKIRPRDFRVQGGEEVDLKKRPTMIERVYKSKAQYQEILTDHVARLSSQQDLLYASNCHAILLIFQAMDAAGKDGAIGHVMSGVNPQGCQVFSFKHPSLAELQHDVLWRTTRDLPERGRIGIFNRSYYEEVLIVRVHRGILASEGLPDAPQDDATLWHDRRLANNRVENSHLPVRRRERAMTRFRRKKTLQKCASVHANLHNHFNLERHLVDRQICKERRSAALAGWQSVMS